MEKNKVWKLRKDGLMHTDEELIAMIKDGRVTGDDLVTSKDMKTWIKIRESIYQFYLRGEENEAV